MTHLPPPHLPPPSSNIASHKKWQRIEILLAAILFGLLGGISGAAIMLGWIWPNYGGGNTWIISQSNVGLTSKQLEDRIEAKMTDQLATVYQNISVLGGENYLAKEDRLGDAIFTGSDGWLAMYLPAYDGNYKNWRVLLPNDSVYQVGQVLYDGYSGLTFIKIVGVNLASSGQEFHVAVFGDKISIGETVFVYQDGKWIGSTVDRLIWQLSAVPHLDTAPVSGYALEQNFKSGSLVIDGQGLVLGIVNNDGEMIPNTYLTRLIPTVLDKETVIYPSLGVEGWFDAEQPIIIKNVRVQGFVVSKILSKNNLLKKGDMIEEINGQIVTPDSLWYNISANQNKEVRLTIFRNGKVIEVVAKVIEM